MLARGGGQKRKATLTKRRRRTPQKDCGPPTPMIHRPPLHSPACAGCVCVWFCLPSFPPPIHSRPNWSPSFGDDKVFFKKNANHSVGGRREGGQLPAATPGSCRRSSRVGRLRVCPRRLDPRAVKPGNSWASVLSCFFFSLVFIFVNQKRNRSKTSRPHQLSSRRPVPGAPPPPPPVPQATEHFFDSPVRRRLGWKAGTKRPIDPNAADAAWLAWPAFKFP